MLNDKKRKIVKEVAYIYFSGLMVHDICIQMLE